MTTEALPELPYEAWRATKDTLHLYAQVVGKVRLASTAPRNHWWHVTLYVDITGLSTRRMRHNDVTFQIDFDFHHDALRMRTLDGREQSFQLRDGLAVADFNRLLRDGLERLGIEVELVAKPFGVPMTTPFAQDTEHASYDAEYVKRFWRVLDWVDDVFGEFAGWYCGKTSPVHLFWHSFDLALTRFSGRAATLPAGADAVTREAYSHEVISFGFWAGDEATPLPAFYSYTAPEPAGLLDQPLVPPTASWKQFPTGRLAVLPYESVRRAADPRRQLLAFLQSAYDAGSTAAGWDRDALRSSYCPPPGQLAALLQPGR